MVWLFWVVTVIKFACLIPISNFFLCVIWNALCKDLTGIYPNEFKIFEVSTSDFIIPATALFITLQWLI